MATAPTPPPALPGLPPAALLYQLSVSHYVSHALFVAAKLRVADLLAAGPADSEQLAKRCEAQPDSLRRVLRLLASVGVFEERDDGRFALLPPGDALREDAPDSALAMVMLFAGPRIQESWRDLEYCVRTGHPAFRRNAPDADPFTEMAQNPEAAALFDKAMATFAPQAAAAVAAAYDFSVFKRVADLGGGNGTLLIGILKANPALRGIVFDQPHVVQRAQPLVAAAGVGDRCELIGGNFFERAPAGAEAYLLKHVIHDWDDAAATAILKHVRAVIPATGRLLIIEGVYPTHIDASLASRGAAANDVNMLVSTGGRQRSEAEFRALYAASGFRLLRVIPTPSPAIALIEGEPA